jgi:uncharacterized protein (TIGR02246 family)
MLARFVVTLAVLVSFSGCTGSRNAAPAPLTEAQVQDFVRGYVAAYNAADATKLMSLIAKEPTVTSAGQGEVFRGWDEIRKNVDQSITTSPGSKITLATMTIQPLGPDAAVAVAPVVLGFTQRPQQVQVNGAASLVIRRSATGLTVVHEHFSLKTL